MPDGQMVKARERYITADTRVPYPPARDGFAWCAHQAPPTLAGLSAPPSQAAATAASALRSASAARASGAPACPLIPGKALMSTISGVPSPVSMTSTP